MCDEKLHIFYHAVGASFLFYAAICRRDGGVGGGVVEGSQTKKPAHRFAGDWTHLKLRCRGHTEQTECNNRQEQKPCVYLS